MDELNPPSQASPNTPPSDIEAEIRRQMLAERAAAAAATASVNTPTAQPGLIERWRSKGGIFGVLASLLALLAKLKGLLVALKFFGIFKTLLITGGSMALSMWAYASYYGWPFGVAMVLMIFLHECGHAFAGHLRGKPWGIMMFVPFMGAFVTVRGGKDAAEDAFIGIMGPVTGTACGLAAWGIYELTGHPFWLAIASWTFMINLFNLAPVAPLDGGWIVPLFSSRILALTAILLIPLARLNPLILFLAVASIPRIISGWNAAKAPRVIAEEAAQQTWDMRRPDAPQVKPVPKSGVGSPGYFDVSSADRWRYGVAYFGLIVFLTLAFYVTNGHSLRRHPLPRNLTPIQASF